MIGIKQAIVAVSMSAALVVSSVLAGTSDGARARPIRTDGLDALIQHTMSQAQIPGAAVAVVSRDETLYLRGFGTAGEGRGVDASTLFELGSNSKAFTGLLAHHWAAKGGLDLDADVRTYLPWLELRWQGTPTRVAVRHFLQHTSGIPSASIAAIPELTGEGALETTVRSLAHSELATVPGERFEYATINYDVVGLVLEVVAKKRFGDMLREELLAPLHLDATYAGRYADNGRRLATGHKIALLGAVEYEAPRYDGNTPAAYVVSNVGDVAAWMQVQLGSARGAGFAAGLASARDPSMAMPMPETTGSYAAGWELYPAEGVVAHSGANPSYSSFVLLSLRDGIGVAVLANVNDGNVGVLARNILRSLSGDALLPLDSDPVEDLSRSMSALAGGALAVTALFVSLLLRKRPALPARGALPARSTLPARSALRASPRRLALLVLLGLVVSVTIVGLYRLPALLFHGYPWKFILVWGPQETPYSIAAMGAALASFAVYATVRIIGVGSATPTPSDARASLKSSPAEGQIP